jgi:catechol 2,3-dioxygenase-like lactoylglutathione lyase family enzyme
MTIGAAAGVITFINTRDPEKAKAFYGETLGFKFIADDGFATVFDLNGTTLRITKIDN